MKGTVTIQLEDLDTLNRIKRLQGIIDGMSEAKELLCKDGAVDHFEIERDRKVKLLHDALRTLNLSHPDNRNVFGELTDQILRRY